MEQAVKSCGEDFDLLCEEIIQIVLEHPLGGFILEFYISIDLYIVDHSTLAKTHATSIEQVGKLKNPTSAEAHAMNIGKVKKTIPERIHGWFKHS